MAWQLQEAKQKFSEVVERALRDGPQVVTRRGQEAVVVISVDEFRRLTGEIPDFKTFLLNGPDFEMLDLRRPRDLPREVEF